MKGACRDIPDTMILQMMGRAGRLQYNSSGCVYIMTKQERVVSTIIKKTKSISMVANRSIELVTAIMVNRVFIDTSNILV